MRRPAPSTLAATLALGALLSCAHHEERLKVKEVDLARLSEEGMSSVEARRSELQRAQDERARAELAIHDTEQQLRLAREDVKVAQAKSTRAGSALKVANDTGQKEAVREAQSQREESGRELDLARTRVGMLSARLSADKAERELAERKVEADGAALEAEKVRSLRAVKDPAADRYRLSSFEERSAGLRREEERARGEYQRREDAYESAKRGYEEKRERQRAVGGAGNQE